MDRKIFHAYKKWCPKRGLNSRPIAYKAIALPLCYLGFFPYSTGTVCLTPSQVLFTLADSVEKSITKS